MDIETNEDVVTIWDAEYVIILMSMIGELFEYRNSINRRANPFFCDHEFSSISIYTRMTTEVLLFAGVLVTIMGCPALLDGSDNLQSDLSDFNNDKDSWDILRKKFKRFTWYVKVLFLFLRFYFSVIAIFRARLNLNSIFCVIVQHDVLDYKI